MAVSYSLAGDSFHADKPQVLSDSHFSPRVSGRSFDVHPDGDRFALVKAPDQPRGTGRDHIILIFNFFDELRQNRITWKVTRERLEAGWLASGSAVVRDDLVSFALEGRHPVLDADG